jgi:hypothetical protein
MGYLESKEHQKLIVHFYFMHVKTILFYAY